MHLGLLQLCLGFREIQETKFWRVLHGDTPSSMAGPTLFAIAYHPGLGIGICKYCILLQRTDLGARLCNTAISLAGRSYREAAWLPAKLLRAERGQLCRNFSAKAAAAAEGGEDDGEASADGVLPEWLEVGLKDKIMKMLAQFSTEFEIKACTVLQLYKGLR